MYFYCTPQDTQTCNDQSIFVIANQISFWLATLSKQYFLVNLYTDQYMTIIMACQLIQMAFQIYCGLTFWQAN